jgi:hypothetical protein
VNLGQIIDALKECDQGSLVEYRGHIDGPAPIGLDSWRGSYEQLALGYVNDHNRGFELLTVADLLANCEAAVGKTFEGWKGGLFVMSRATPVWVSNRGDYERTVVLAVEPGDPVVVLRTASIEDYW